MQDLNEFFQDKNNGSGSTSYYENEKALAIWLQKLRGILSDPKNSEDSKLVDVVEAMCKKRKQERLTTRDLVRRIFKLEGPYHGLCCSDRSSAPSEHHTFSRSSSFLKSDASDATGPEDNDDSTVTELVPIKETSGIVPTNYSAPSVEDAETTAVVIYNRLPKDSRNVLEDVTELMPSVLDNTNTYQVSNNQNQSVTQSIDDQAKCSTPHEEQMSRDISGANQKRPAANWDKSGIQLREAGKVKTTLGKSLDATAQLPGPTNDMLPCPWPRCRPRQGVAYEVFDGVQALQQHLREIHFVHDIGVTCLKDGSRDTRNTQSMLNSETGAFKILKSKHVHFPDQKWPQNRAPAVIERRAARSIYDINAEMPIAPGIANIEQMEACAKLGKPSSTYAPSYLLGTYAPCKGLTRGCTLTTKSGK